MNLPPPPRLVAWEITKRCKMGCVYCRASAGAAAYPGELSTKKCIQIIDQISLLGASVLILSGGDPLLREDVFEIAKYATFKKLKVVMAVNPDTLDEDKLEQIEESGVRRISISLDGAEPKIHDELRGVPGAFSQAKKAMKLATSMGVEFQINTTVSRYNFDQISQILDVAVKMGARSFHPFFLVPTGRGEKLRDKEISPLDYEHTLTYLAQNLEKFPLEIKATCAPHYYRILHQLGKLRMKEGESTLRATGCLGGISFCFISNVGVVQPCGYLQVKAGDLRVESLGKIWSESPVFNQLRDRGKLEGKCGICRYRRICGGCRARAYSVSGNYLAEEPYCVYEPATRKN